MILANYHLIKLLILSKNNGDIMLILTRRPGEKLMIGKDIVVTVLGIRGNQVRIGVDAPDSVQIHREEIFNKIVKEDSYGNK